MQNASLSSVSSKNSSYNCSFSSKERNKKLANLSEHLKNNSRDEGISGSKNLDSRDEKAKTCSSVCDIISENLVVTRPSITKHVSLGSQDMNMISTKRNIHTSLYNDETSTESEKPATSRTKNRKRDHCFYCEDEVLNFARHIQRCHSHEIEVTRIMSIPPNTRERKDLISKLRRKGNYVRNMSGCFKPVRTSLSKDNNSLPCSNCLGFFSSKLLYRHRKKCIDGSKGRAQADGQNIMVYNTNKNINLQLKNLVFPRMLADKISLVAKSDPLICAFGAQYLKIHREKHFINVTSRKMREISRLLLVLKEKEPMITSLLEALQPKYFDLICESTKTVAKYDNIKDSYGAPTYARNIGTSLKQCCDIAIRFNLKNEESSVQKAETEVNLKNMIHLFNASWKFEISSQAGSDLNMKKWNKVTIVPLAEDLIVLKKYLIEKANTAINILKTDPNDKEAFGLLLETIYCRIILLNRKRPGELQRLSVQTYLISDSKSSDNYEEFDPIISPTEKILLKTFKRVVIRGKRGRGVAVLISTDVQEHIKILLSLRKHSVDDKNPYLFGKPGVDTPISGYKVLQYHARVCGAKNPSSITCTKLRKHLATLSQLFSMKETEIDQLAAFMGHTMGVHKNSYRLPDDVYQTAKISKLLLLLESGNLKQYKGKTLDEIEINIDEDLFDITKNEDTDEEKSDEEVIMENELFLQNKAEGIDNFKISDTKRQKKRILVKWTEDQKKIASEYFHDHIRKKIPPKKTECEAMRTKYPGVFDNKDWLKLKVFIQNIYTKKNEK
ncbi:uncharacterized protein [Leptinotarsa decemlineata]|uniref:uncharacterized protein n=1 Tax=Leptinotarsa decemlineata TaxID=7539 RepID=UPI003D30C282